MIFQLSDKQIAFPDPQYAEEDGLLAVGGDLSPKRLLLAYRNGIFPWYSEDSPILWYAPQERFVIFPKNIHISKSLRQIIQKDQFKVTVNHAFNEVICHCASVKRQEQDGTWITSEMISAYNTLHKLGYAHSIEVWEQDNLAGGLYGILIDRVFCGESMFSLRPNASKIALAYLARSFDIDLIDCQFHTTHLERMGGQFIPYEEYHSFLTNGQHGKIL